MRFCCLAGVKESIVSEMVIATSMTVDGFATIASPAMRGEKGGKMG